MAPEQAGLDAGGELLDVAVGHVQQRHLSLGGQQLTSLLDAGLPRLHRDPHERVHQITFRANHKPTVDASSAGGTVRIPRRRKSPTGIVCSCACTIRRHSNVASEPA